MQERNEMEKKQITTLAQLLMNAVIFWLKTGLLSIKGYLLYTTMCMWINQLLLLWHSMRKYVTGSVKTLHVSMPKLANF